MSLSWNVPYCHHPQSRLCSPCRAYRQRNPIAKYIGWRKSHRSTTAPRSAVLQHSWLEYRDSRHFLGSKGGRVGCSCSRTRTCIRHRSALEVYQLEQKSCHSARSLEMLAVEDRKNLR